MKESISEMEALDFSLKRSSDCVDIKIPDEPICKKNFNYYKFINM